MRSPASTLEWTRSVLGSARFFDPQGVTGIELYDTRSLGVSGWRHLDARTDYPGGIALGRRRYQSGQRSYYLLRFGSRGLDVISELDLSGSEIRRLQLGLRAIAGRPARYRIFDCNKETCLIRVPAFLPRAESVLLEAVGREPKQSDTGTRSISIPIYTRDAVVEILLSLGLVEAGTKHE